MRKDKAKKFGEKLLKLLGDRNMSETELANILDIDPHTISRYVNGVIMPRKNRIKDIAEVFGIDPDELTVKDDDDGYYA